MLFKHLPVFFMITIYFILALHFMTLRIVSSELNGKMLLKCRNVIMLYNLIVVVYYYITQYLFFNSSTLTIIIEHFL